jgi:PAS domain S-box-containing protein
VSTVNQNSSALRLLVGGDQESFDIVLADQTRLRGVLDIIFAFVGLFSIDGMVVDVNRLPVQVSKLRRGDFVGRRFVDVPWFAHSAVERGRVADALERAAKGEKVRLEITIVGADAEIRYVDAAFAPLHDSGGSITHVVGTGVDSTVRKRAQDALSASEARLAEAQRVAHVGSWEWSVATNTVVWSDELHRIYGVSKEQWNGSYEAFLSRVHPDDLDHTRAVVSHALLNVTPFVYDHRIVRADGRVRMLHTRGDVVPDARGKPERLVGSCWDITDRWVATRQLEDSVSLLRSTLEATADGILLVDLSGEVRALNQRLRALWRLPDEVGEGTTIDELLAMVSDQLEDPGLFLQQTSQLYREPGLERLDVLRFKDGRVFERYSRPQREGAAISGRVCSFRDITQRERLLRDAEAARIASERARQEMDHVLERVSDGFVALDRQWRYTYVNTCGGRLLGREAPSLLGKHIWTEFPEGVGQTFHLAYERAVAEQKPQWIREHFPPWNRWFENRIYPSADGVSVFFTDVTQQQETEEQLRASTNQLRALAARLDAIREEERRTMAREIHDQIGQALTALKLDLASLRAHLPAGTAREEVHRRVGDMDRLLEETLETTRRLSAELRPAMLEELGLAAAIGWQVRELEARTGIRCRVDLAPVDLDLPEGKRISPAAALVLFRILQEALTNVARHAAAHQVHVQLAAEPEAFVLTVHDDGRGISSEEKTRASSLGLLGMRERALVLGGEVTILGVAGSGTTVTARLPRESGFDARVDR